MVPLYREAIEAWERGDDAVLQATEAGELLHSRQSHAASEAELGCSVAAAALAENDDEAIRDALMAHYHDERCGGRDFPDDPKPHRLRSVG
ncbi:MAG: hypothetical protein ACR2L4_11285 [Actinomycetota bacterium]